ncbi:DUF3332 domain-containing protein [Limibacter armeniacum]|uniref:DUF3332 domain-containing protein n=1 Tax=Limibacter armeniacum TaxID=466084 RepID=UPI002FE516B1
MKYLFVALLILGVSVLQTSCYGPFRLTNQLHSWNGQVGTKFVNALVFLAFVIIPVYEIALLGDGLIFNTIEFWGGENPISMKEGDKEIKQVMSNGKFFEIEKTKNRILITQLNSLKKENSVEFLFDIESSTWMLNSDGKLKKVVSFDATDKVLFHYPDGSTSMFDSL